MCLFKIPSLRELFIAKLAGEGRLLCVGPEMVHNVPRFNKLLVAVVVLANEQSAAALAPRVILKLQLVLVSFERIVLRRQVLPVLL